MPQLATCLGILRGLIAEGDMADIQLAVSAIDVYCDLSPTQAGTRGLRLLQLDVLNQRDNVPGSHRDFADAVNDYIVKKLTDKDRA
jgi:hypothetical protein